MAQIEVDAFLADSVTVAQGKLYVLGAGWNRISVGGFPARHDRVGIGLLFRVPAGAPRTTRAFEVRVLGPDGTVVTIGAAPAGRLDRIRGEFTAGGADEQVVPMALHLNGLPLPGPGDYRVVISVDEGSERALTFRVEARAQTAPPASPQPAARSEDTGTSGYL